MESTMRVAISVLVAISVTFAAAAAAPEHGTIDAGPPQADPGVAQVAEELAESFTDTMVTEQGSGQMAGTALVQVRPNTSVYKPGQSGEGDPK